jgi:hypothetical protein
MGLFDWLTDGIGSMGSGMGGGSEMAPPDLMPAGGPTPPLNFQRPEFAPPPPVAPPPNAGPYAAGADPMTAGGDLGNGPGLPPQPPVPMPQARPAAADVPAQPPVPPGMMPGSPPPTVAPPGPGLGVGAPPDIGGPDVNSAVRSYQGAGGNFMPGPNGDNNPATGLIGRALGLDANRERSIKGGLAGGFKAAGNSAGKSPFQAFASGAGESLDGSQKADDKGYDQRLKALQLAVNAQRAGDTAEYNRNYASYLGAKLKADTDKVSGGGKNAWNKPDSQKFIDASNALAKDPQVRASQKMLEQTAKDGTPEQIAQAKATHDALIGEKQKMYLTGVGLNPQQIAKNIQTPPGSRENPHASPVSRTSTAM